MMVSGFSSTNFIRLALRMKFSSLLEADTYNDFNDLLKDIGAKDIAQIESANV